MNLAKLFEMQRVLDERIIKEKGLEGQDLLPNTILALQVELGELANEWRGFKHWSDNREPKKGDSAKIDCDKCSGKGFWFNGERLWCSKCNRTGKITNPLLEEYVDCLHFFLSIAIQKGWTELMYIHEEAIDDIREEGFDGGITGAFIELEYWLLKSYMEKTRNEVIEEKSGMSKQEFCFKNSWFIFVAIGLVGFGFTPEQIEDAYMDKNKVNHERQASGY